MIFILCGVGLVILGCIYFMFRNEWVVKISLKMVDDVYRYKRNLIENGNYDKSKLEYENIPEYDFMLYRKFYKWNKDYFVNLMNEHLKNK